MAQTSWPFENIDTTETQFSQWARNINEGIKQGTGSELAVSAPGGGMTVQVASGQAMIRGHYYSNTATETLTIAAANPSNPRIDSVVLELDPSVNTVILKVLAGTPAGSPVAPSLTQTDSGIYQLRLANVAVGAGVLQIVSGNLTDLRTYMFAGVGRWTTATRPANPVQNQTVGFNTTINQHEYWNGSAWVPFTPADAVRDTDYAATGDILYASAADTPTALPIGANGTVLKSDGTEPFWGSNPSPLSAYELINTTDGNLSNDAGDYIITIRNNGNRDTNVYLDSTYITSLVSTSGFSVGSTALVTLPANARAEAYPSYATSTAQFSTGTIALSGTNYVLTNATAGGIWYGTTTGSGLVQSSRITLPFNPVGNVYANSTYVITGGGTNQLATSTDAVTWTTRNASGTDSIRKIGFGNALFVAGTNAGNLYTSSDAITWTTRAVATFVQSWSNPHFATGLGGWVVGGTFNSLATSTDGITWTTKTNTLSTASLYGIASSGSIIVFGGQNGFMASAPTTTGTYTSRTSGFTTAQDILGVAFGNGVFVAVGQNGVITSSTNGTSWTARTSGTAEDIHSVTFSNGRFIAIVRGTTSVSMITSTDGTTWTTILTPGNYASTLGNATYGMSAQWDGTRWFMASADGVDFGNVHFLNSDLISFTRRGEFNSTNTNYYASFGETGLYVAGRNAGVIQASTDLATYTWTDLPSASDLRVIQKSAIAGYIAGGIAGASNGGLATSTNGITWTTRSSGLLTNGVIAGFATGPSNMIAVGQTDLAAGYIINSTNGITWGPVTAPTASPIVGATFANGEFLIIASNREIYASTNTTTWTLKATLPPLQTWTGGSIGDYLKFINNEYVVHGNVIFTSTDAITWRLRRSGTNTNTMIDEGTTNLSAQVATTTLVRSNEVGNLTLRMQGYPAPTLVS